MTVGGALKVFVWGFLALLGLLFVAGSVFDDSDPSPRASNPAMAAGESAISDVDAAIAYATGAQDRLELLSDASFALERLFSNPRIGDDEWTIDVALQLGIYQLIYDEELAAEPPPELEKVHQTLLAAFSLVDDAATDIAYGIDHNDSLRLIAAKDKIERSGDLIVDATEQIRELTAQIS